LGTIITENQSPFNTPFEAGLRAVCVLVESYPRALDLPILVNLDYLVVHSGDVGGPPSLHAPVPLRSGEMLVRRGLIERGLLLMVSRRLIERAPHVGGVFYRATDLAGPFVSNFATPYNRQLHERAEWAVAEFADIESGELSHRLSALFEPWKTQFQALQNHASP
jgi:ABC-three component (ABC-3C) system Middle Component 2